MLRSYLFEAAGVLLTRVPKWSAVKAWGLGSPSATGSARPRLQSRVSSRSFCIACGSTEPSSTGRRRRLPPSEGLQSPSRDDGDGEFVRFFASVRKADRDCTLNRQRHLTPSCGGFTPTAERTVGPARMIVESLTPRPGIREHYRRKATARHNRQ